MCSPVYNNVPRSVEHCVYGTFINNIWQKDKSPSGNGRSINMTFTATFWCNCMLLCSVASIAAAAVAHVRRIPQTTHTRAHICAAHACIQKYTCGQSFGRRRQRRRHDTFLRLDISEYISFESANIVRSCTRARVALTPTHTHTAKVMGMDGWPCKLHINYERNRTHTPPSAPNARASCVCVGNLICWPFKPIITLRFILSAALDSWPTGRMGPCFRAARPGGRQRGGWKSGVRLPL